MMTNQTPWRLDAALLDLHEHNIFNESPEAWHERGTIDMFTFEQVRIAALHVLAECRALATDLERANGYADDWKKLSITENARVTELHIINDALTAELEQATGQVNDANESSRWVNDRLERLEAFRAQSRRRLAKLEGERNRVAVGNGLDDLAALGTMPPCEHCGEATRTPGPLHKADCPDYVPF